MYRGGQQGQKPQINRKLCAEIFEQDYKHSRKAAQSYEKLTWEVA